MSAGTLPTRKWLNVNEAATWCGVSVASIRRAKAKGQLNPKTTATRGGKELYRIADLEAWLEGMDDA